MGEGNGNIRLYDSYIIHEADCNKLKMYNVNLEQPLKKLKAKRYS